MEKIFFLSENFLPKIQNLGLEIPVKLSFFSNFIFYGVCLPQLGSVPAANSVVAGGCDWSIQ